MYFFCRRWISLGDSDSSEDDNNISNSFQIELDERLNDLKMGKMNNFNISDRDLTTSAFDNTNSTVRRSSLGGDETFRKFEKLCDETNPLENLKDDIDMSQLSDMEEPSHFWENTSNNYSKVFSPVKMCGILRPSTIMEEDSQMMSTTCDISSLSSDEFIQLIDHAIEENESGSKFVKKNQKKYETTDNDDNSYIIPAECSAPAVSITNSPTNSMQNYLHSPIPNQKNDFNFRTPTSTPTSKHDLIKFTPFEKNEVSNYSTTDSIINLNEIESNDIIELSSYFENDKVNRPFNNTLEDISSLQSDSFLSNNQNSSYECNDTLEEVDYLMRKGLKYIEKNSALAQNISKSISQITRCRTPKTPETVIKRKPTTNVRKSAEDDVKLPSYPKLTPFRELSAKKNNFDHLSSPLQKKMNKTPGSSLSSENRNFRRDIFESKLYNRDSPHRKSTTKNLEATKSHKSFKLQNVSIYYK